MAGLKLGAGSSKGLHCFRAVAPYHSHIITRATKAHECVIGKDFELAQGPLLNVNVCSREWKGQKSFAGVGFINADIDLLDVSTHLEISQYM